MITMPTNYDTPCRSSQNADKGSKNPKKISDVLYVWPLSKGLYCDLILITCKMIVIRIIDHNISHICCR